MILAQRPFTIFDVDVAGAGALLMLLVGGYFLIGAPALRDRAECDRLRSEIVSTRQEAERVDRQRLSIQAGMDRYASALSLRAESAPLEQGLSTYLARLAACADECGIEVLQLQPAAIQKSDGGRFSDVRVNARGAFADFVRLIDRLRRENECQKFTEFNVTGGGSAGGNSCTISWTVRLSMLGAPIALGPAAAHPAPKER